MLMSFDLSCAFDTVDHAHLIKELHRFGIDGHRHQIWGVGGQHPLASDTEEG